MAERRSRLVVRALNTPALHFAVIGLALFLARGYGASAAGGHAASVREPIVIDAGRLEALRRGYASTAGAAPNPAAESHMIASEIDDELLYREALRLGLDRSDRTVFWRLVDKMKFLGEARDGENDQSLFRRAIALGLQEKDPVIRGLLIRKFGMLIRLSTSDGPPTETELRDYYDRHPALYARPERVALVHVFFSRDRRRERASADAERVLDGLRHADDGVRDVAYGSQHAGAGDEEAIRLGDPFLGGHVFVEQSHEALAKLFGSDFADEVMRVPPGSWQGPIRSAYGFHVVRVRERVDAGRLPLASVRSQVMEGVEEERRDARLSAKLAELRAKYDVRIEGAAVEGKEAAVQRKGDA